MCNHIDNQPTEELVDLLLYCFLGFITSFLGTIFPSMLSMTTVKIGIKEHTNKAISFAAGVSTIVIGQAYVAVAFSKLLLSNPTYLETLQKVGVFVFFMLSVFFFREGMKSRKVVPGANERKVKGFVTGLIFSLLNMFAIPFYVGVTSFLVMLNLYEFSPLHNLYFVLGSALGTFTLLYIYASIAKRIEKRMIWLSNQMDFILGFVTLSAALVNALDLLF